MAVVGVLIAIMLPSLAAVRETAHQVVCRSNVRQLGYGVEMYAEANKRFIPRTITLANGSELSFQTMTLRFRPGQPGLEYLQDEQWDGLGLLYLDEYLPAPKLFYCPSHRGQNRFPEYADRWASDEGEVVGNFQYRGRGPSGIGMTFNLDQIKPSGALVVDGLRSQADFNHQVGANVLRADLSVSWFVDSGRTVSAALPKGEETPTATTWLSVWQQFDLTTVR